MGQFFTSSKKDLPHKRKPPEGGLNSWPAQHDSNVRPTP